MTFPANMSLEEKTIQTIRTLSIDAVQNANSGHPGAPLGLAPLAYHLWMEVMCYNPKNPHWHGRDRFVLSAGHASMLQYATLHLTGYDLSLDDIKDFRQLDSKTPGHPEVHHTPGIETTTGPLGQGISTAVGMALGEAMLADRFNREQIIVDNYTYVIASDGDLMEGVSHEAASLAGHLGLGKLIVYYDDNSITIDGTTDIAFSEDVAERFAAYGWDIIHVDDINDLDALRDATRQAQENLEQPTLVLVRSIIGYGSPNKEGTSAAHGSPLGPEEVARTKERLGWPTDKHFFIPEDVLEHTRTALEDGADDEDEWNQTFQQWAEEHPDLATLWHLHHNPTPDATLQAIPLFADDQAPLATRKASAKVLKHLLTHVPSLVGGSADLAGSNGTQHFEFGEVQSGDYSGQMIHFGIREHAMAAVCSGLSLYGGLRPFCATFLVFTDYLRPSLRLAALMNVPSIFIMTHDSIGLGEDGPTHQPIEHLAACRSIPNLHVLRPGDAHETLQAWIHAISRTDGPTLLALTRQSVPTSSSQTSSLGLHKGGYILDGNTEEDPEIILMATGSELAPTLEAHRALLAKGIRSRCVSMPCTELFLEQPSEWRDHVLPPSCRKRIAVEAGTSMGWAQFTGLDGDIISIDRFGASAPCKDLMNLFGFTPDAILKRALALLDA